MKDSLPIAIFLTRHRRDRSDGGGEILTRRAEWRVPGFIRKFEENKNR